MTIIDAVSDVFNEAMPNLEWVRFDEVIKRACFMLQTTNFEIDVADVLKRLQLACDSPTVLEHEARRARGEAQHAEVACRTSASPRSAVFCGEKV